MTNGHVIQVEECGPPEVLKWVSVPIPDPGPREALVRNKAVGLNFMDIQLRAGRYKSACPFVLGGEGAGVIEAVGSGVSGFAVGDRVGYIDPMGAYAERLIRPAARLVKLPDDIDDVLAAGIMLKGMTAEYLIRRTHKVAAGETILVHAAAGGVGQILCQWASGIGATVIGTVGSRAKAEVAEAAGCAHVLVLGDEDFAARVDAITEGKRAAAVYDSVGADTFQGSLNCLAPFGVLALFGASSGPIPPFDVQTLATKRSIFLTWPGLFQYNATTERLNESAAALFDAVRRGLVRAKVNQTYALRDAPQAHRDLEARKLTGSTVLIP